jgi:hypothetical protein
LTNAEDINFMDANDTKWAQEVLGCLLFYACAIDCTTLPAICMLALQQAKPTITTMKGITQLLNYATMHPNAVV